MKLSTIIWIGAGITGMIAIFGSCPLWVPVIFCCVAGILGSTGN